MPSEIWGYDLHRLLWLFNINTEGELLSIWHTMDPLQKGRAWAAIESSFRKMSVILRFRAPYIHHYDTVMVIYLSFNTKDPGRVGDAVNIFLFLDISPSEGLGAAFIERC